MILHLHVEQLKSRTLEVYCLGHCNKTDLAYLNITLFYSCQTPRHSLSTFCGPVLRAAISCLLYAGIFNIM